MIWFEIFLSESFYVKYVSIIVFSIIVLCCLCRFFRFFVVKIFMFLCYFYAIFMLFFAIIVRYFDVIFAMCYSLYSYIDVSIIVFICLSTFYPHFYPLYPHL